MVGIKKVRRGIREDFKANEKNNISDQNYGQFFRG